MLQNLITCPHCGRELNDIQPETANAVLEPDVPIDELNIAIRTYNALRRGHGVMVTKQGKEKIRACNTIGDILAVKDASYFKSLVNFGRWSMWDLLKRMREHGFDEWADNIYDQLRGSWRATR